MDIITDNLARANAQEGYDRVFMHPRADSFRTADVGGLDALLSLHETGQAFLSSRLGRAFSNPRAQPFRTLVRPVLNGGPHGS